MNSAIQWAVVVLIVLLYIISLVYFNVTEIKPPKCVQVSDAPYGSFDCRYFRPDYALDTTGTLPFLSGGHFILYADYIYDHHVRNIVTSELKDGDMIYVKIDFVDQFFERIFPRIKTKFILVTHNSDYFSTTKRIDYLNDDKLIAWFGLNPGMEHPKLIPTPIGFENAVWYPEKIKNLRQVLTRKLVPWEERKTLLYLNFNSGTNIKARAHLFDSFRNQTGVVINERKLDYATYLTRLSESKFVLCPRGNGIDTYRYYESLLMGAIPVVENSTLYPIFNETTTLIVPDINKLDMEMLRNPKPYIKDWSFSKKILFWDTWLKRVENLRSKYRQKTTITATTTKKTLV